MKPTTKQILIIAAIIFVVLLSVGIWFYRKGKKQVTIQKPPLDIPGAQTGNNTFAVSSADITSIADALFRDMDGFNWLGHDVEPYQRLDALSDTDFVNVYNTFNTEHQAASGQTLKQWIQGEDYAFNDVQQSILDRMGRLNLI